MDTPGHEIINDNTLVHVKLKNFQSINVCRICLYQQNTTRSIFEQDILNMLLQCTSLKLNINDGLPSQICNSCVFEMTQAYNFKQKAETSDNRLRQYATLEHINDDSAMIHGGSARPLMSDSKDNHLMNGSDSAAVRDEADYMKIDADESSNSKRNEHICETCSKTFKKKSCLKMHILRSHVVLCEKKFECIQCGNKYHAQNELKIHMRKHTGERPLICRTCGKSFADPRSLAKHIKIHSGEKNFSCNICSKRFIHAYTLKAHIRTHTGEKPFVCSNCGYSFATSTQLTLHMRTHTQEKPYLCSLCPKTFSSGSGLATHQLTHTGERRYICSLCGKGSRTSTDLTTHLRTHSGEKPFECKVPNCKKKYKTHSQLSAHIRTHTGEKRHCCTVCFKSFADTSQLKNHSNTHTGVKPYVCPICGCCFAQSGSLCAHMSKQHENSA